MDQEKINLISASAQVARVEGLTDDEAVAVRASVIFDDAQKEHPETVAGTEAKRIALEIGAVQKTGIESPYIEKPKYDYEKLRDETSIPAIEDILRKLGEHATFLPIPTKPTSEYEKASDEAYGKLMLDTFKILNTRKIGMSEYKFIFDSLKTTISSLEAGIMQQVTGHRHEIMSRLFGAKNPGTEKFDANYATYEDLVNTIEKVRKDTGNNMEDYFNIQKRTVE